MKDEYLNVYTDGSCVPNPGRGGWGFWVPRTLMSHWGGECSTTNNRMEFEAIRQALTYVTDAKVRIHTDSQLAVYVLIGRWKARANKDLVEAIRKLCDGRDVQFSWLRGHNGHLHNERADQLANAGLWSSSSITPTRA